MWQQSLFLKIVSVVIFWTEKEVLFLLLLKLLLYYSMDRQLSEIGNIPVTISIIESLYPELKYANKKVPCLEKQGVIIRLKLINPEHLSSDLIANHFYTLSYISMSTALRYYGLMPEAVYIYQSMTVKTFPKLSNSSRQLWLQIYLGEGISDRSKNYE